MNAKGTSTKFFFLKKNLSKIISVIMINSYSEVVKQNKKKNKQDIFDRQNEMCEFFCDLCSTNGVDINYRVSNDCILIKVAYDKNSQWNANQGKRTIWKLLEKYKLDLLGYEKKMIHFNKSVSFWEKRKINLRILCSA